MHNKMHLLRSMRFKAGVLANMLVDRVFYLLERAVIPLLLVSSLALLGTVVWKSRAWFSVASSITGDGQAKDRIEAENEIMRTVAQVLGGAFVLAGLYFTGKNIFAERRSQMSDRFGKALEGLPDQNEVRRLGSIHSLESLSRESAADYPRVIEFVAGYVRQETAREDYGAESTPRADVQQALNLICRRRRAYRSGEKDRIDLRNARLRGADLRNANLEGVMLDGADLREAVFHRAFLRHATFAGARLEKANLNQADLRDANFWKAKLDSAQLRGALLERTSFASASLRDVSLEDSALEAVIFQQTDLSSARLRGARLRRCVFAGCSLSDADLASATIEDAVGLREDQLGETSGRAGTPDGRRSGNTSPKPTPEQSS